MYYKYILHITKTEKRRRTSGFFVRNKVWQSTQDKNENGSVMTQKETKWSIHLEIMQTQGYLCDIHTKKMETLMCYIHTKIMETHKIFLLHSHKEMWDSSTQKKR